MGVVEQKIKYAINHPGTADTYVSVADNPTLDLATNFTIEVLVKLHEPRYSPIIIKGTGDPSGVNYLLLVNDSWRAVVFYVGSGSTSKYVSKAYTLDKWQRWSAVRKGSNLYLYRDGVQVGSETIDFTPITNSEPVKIIANWGAKWFKGKLAQLLIYKGKALSKSELNWNLLNPDRPITDNLVLWLDPRTFDASAGMWWDLSGNSNNCTIYGSLTKTRIVPSEVITL